MQLDGATELEQRIYNLCLRVEQEMGASDLETSIVSTLSDAGHELQRLRLSGKENKQLSAVVDEEWGGDGWG